MVLVTYKKISLFTLLLLSYFLILSPKIAWASEIFTPWLTTTSLSQTYANNQSYVHNGKLYLFGGTVIQGPTRANVLSNLINVNGSLGSWSSQASMNNALIWHSSFQINDRVYIAGGAEENIPGNPISVNSVSYAGLDGAGNINGWTSLSGSKLLPEPLSLGSMAVVGNWVYYFGGATWPGAPIMSNDIYKTALAGDGSIGNWQAANISLPTSLATHGTIVQGNKIFLLGGTTNSSFSPTNKVYVFASNPADGNLTRLADEDNLPFNSRSAMIIKAGGYVIHAGGVVGSGSVTNKVYFAPIDGSGNIGAWELSSHLLPQINCCTTIASWNNYVYIIGGHTGGGGPGNYYNSVIYSKIGALAVLPNLSVPDVKQFSLPWGDDIYDQAPSWSTSPTMARWGCAVTSASMVLQFYGHTSAHPDTLNDWLKIQADGYVRNGLLNWLAVSRYTRLHDSPTSPTLEYRRLGNSQVDLIAELTAGRPAILAEPGHFLVAKSQTAGSFGINDPAYTTKPTLASYGNTFANLGSYRPTHTDLSYIMLVADAGINMAAWDPANNPVGQTSLEQPLIDDIGNVATSGAPLKIFLLPIPATGNYRVELTGSAGAYQLDAYLYNPQGDVVKSTYKGLIAPSETDTVVINIGPNSKTTPQITIDSLLADLEDANNAGKISRPQIYQALKTTLLSAKLLIQKGLNTSAKKVLNSTLVTLKTSTPRFIDLATSQILQENTQLLINKL